MRAFPAAVFCLCLFPAQGGVSAQEAVPQTLEIGPSGEAYLDSIRYRGIDSDVGYYDPTRAMPRLETDAVPPPPAREEPQASWRIGDLSWLEWVVIAVAVGVLVALVTLVIRAGGSFALSFDREAQNPARGRGAGGREGRQADLPADLQAILATGDRRRALVMLVQAALARTVQANGVLQQPSWTFRDSLRHIPRTQPHVDALRALVLAGERVLFGNRDVTEPEFQSHVAAVRPLIAGDAP